MSSGLVGIVARNHYAIDRFHLSMTLRRSKL
jgi:hypothetical protein